MRYYISDLHFFHGALNDRMDCRGFGSVEQMNEYMISQWNGRVRDRDEVVVLGDFSMGKTEETNAVLNRLNGKKCLIVGNHDHFIKYRNFDLTAFEWIEPYKELNDERRKIILSHYPIMCYNGQYRRNGEGVAKTYMLYGHVHNTRDELMINEWQKMVGRQLVPSANDGKPQPIPCQMINCFCMFSDYVPLSLDEWIELDGNRRMGLGQMKGFDL